MPPSWGYFFAWRKEERPPLHQQFLSYVLSFYTGISDLNKPGEIDVRTAYENPPLPECRDE
jgi:hypothetical protein